METLVGVILLAVFLGTIMFVWGLYNQCELKKASSMIPGDIIGHEWIDAREVRKKLKERGVSLSGVAFYNHMSTLEGMINQRDVPVYVDGVQIQRRQYQLRPEIIRVG
ncbi:MAG: hypothetical protein RLY66_373 [Candidatus Parcubacteria bacterium]|jgi:hypothetical protein